MAAIDLETVKDHLRVTHNFDDDELRRAIRGAEDEAKRYCNRTELPTLPHDYPDSEGYSEDVPSSEDPVAPSVVEAVLLLVKASYEATDPAAVAGYRMAAEVKLAPYRVGWGA